MSAMQEEREEEEEEERRRSSLNAIAPSARVAAAAGELSNCIQTYVPALYQISHT